jgi:prepilin-type N-terminal cleavage/methylation domain-containing protein
MMASRVVRTKAFSLIELVIVVVIIGIIAAIAIPRMSRGATGAADSALTGNLATLRNAIDLFQTEHGGNYPAVGTIVAQLTTYTDDAGTGTAASKDATHVYGPYIRAIPPLPVSTKKGKTGIAAADGPGVGWIYDATSGKITANSGAEKDERGVLYTDY